MRPTITRADQLKPKPDESNLGFGIHFTDHMFNMDSGSLWLRYGRRHFSGWKNKVDR